MSEIVNENSLEVSKSCCLNNEESNLSNQKCSEICSENCCENCNENCDVNT